MLKTVGHAIVMGNGTEEAKKEAPEFTEVYENVPEIGMVSTNRITTEDERNKWAYDKAYKETLGKINYKDAPQAVMGRVEVPATPDTFVPKSPQEQILERVALMKKHGLSVADIKAEIKKILPDPISKKEKAELDKIYALTNKALAETKKAENGGSGKKPYNTVPKDIGENLYNMLGSYDGRAMVEKYEAIAKDKNIPLQDVYKILDYALQPTTEGWFYNVSEETYDERVNALLEQQYPNKF